MFVFQQALWIYLYDGLFSFCSLTYSREFVKKYQMTRVEIPKNGFNGKLAEVETHERFITKKKGNTWKALQETPTFIELAITLNFKKQMNGFTGWLWLWQDDLCYGRLKLFAFCPSVRPSALLYAEDWGWGACLITRVSGQGWELIRSKSREQCRRGIEAANRSGSIVRTLLAADGISFFFPQTISFLAPRSK